jgi:hypothetical protein
MKWLETIVVRRFLQIAAILSGSIVLAICVALSKRLITLETLSKATDSLLKGLAIMIGALWTLNRYFATRTDYPQLKVEMATDLIPSDLLGKNQDQGIFTYRLDVVNTGKVLLPVTGYRVELANVFINNGSIVFEHLHQWPAEGMHQGSPIEPGSWGAISNAIVCPKDVQAIRVFLEIELEGKAQWTWHRITSVAKEPGKLDSPVPVATEEDKS